MRRVEGAGEKDFLSLDVMISKINSNKDKYKDSTNIH